MEKILLSKPGRFEDFDLDAKARHAIATLEDENGKLRQLVVRLSETILRSAAKL